MVKLKFSASKNTVKPSSLTLLLGIWIHLSYRRRIQLGAVFLVMLTSGVAELVSLGAVVPFLAVLSNPDLIWKQPIAQEFAGRVGITSSSQLILPAVLVFGSAIIVSTLVRLANIWINGRLAAAIGSDFSFEAFRRTLYQPYEVHLQRNSASVINSVTTQVRLAVGALNAVLQIFTSAIVAVGLIAGLLLIDASVALSALFLFASSYGAIVIATKSRLYNNGRKITNASTKQIKVLQESLGAVRDVVLNGNYDKYLKIYKGTDSLQRNLQAENAFLGAFPRYSLETIALIAIAIFGGFLLFQKGNNAPIVHILGSLALGAQRLLPALQQIYRGWSILKGCSAGVESVLAMLDQRVPTVIESVNSNLVFNNIRLDNVHFSYGLDEKSVLSDIDLEINAGERIGIIGATGSGKSTMVDILIGLLKPLKGRVLINGLDIYHPNFPQRLLSLRSIIAHVPQSIYLCDGTIAENIAFDSTSEAIDMERVRDAARQAQIASFIENSPGGYQSFVGERGIRLSGGQKQRMGIARALYKQASILVLDEATSALDTSTENSVMQAIDGLSRDLTIITIAHRLTTISRCDRVVEIECGTIKRIIHPSTIENNFFI